MLRRQRAIEIVPGSKPLRRRRYDVPQHLTPETSDALRFCAVEGDLDLPDRRHQSTIEAGLSPSPRARPWLGCGACGRLLKMSRTLSRGMPSSAVIGTGSGGCDAREAEHGEQG